MSLERITVRLEPRGKGLKDEERLSTLSLPQTNAQLYFKDLGRQIAWKTVGFNTKIFSSNTFFRFSYSNTPVRYSFIRCSTCVPGLFTGRVRRDRLRRWWRTHSFCIVFTTQNAFLRHILCIDSATEQCLSEICLRIARIIGAFLHSSPTLSIIRFTRLQARRKSIWESSAFWLVNSVRFSTIVKYT